ncbi:nitrate ABC transporter substrate-binding protein [Paucilactobacillus hokkaidonensis JCM 18461]|uniref:ABC-type nitrate sulfonate bicarbonate transporter n=2 Tax=Paucilactobacillus hokkaidonensis TaxID=1193095 RepID=A0ABR5Q7W4_9LACO|nr:ABC-type nitrate sulfonate bicarbonate transporter [Paucilactobacillus hokkaidonensis]BAP84929.1 nitrate ABC transporter substrate-binding protein [Paucilactobacillus hokkaidonensis JCM 18461]
MKKKNSWKKVFLTIFVVFWIGVAFYGFRQVGGGSSDLKTVTIGYQKADPIDIAKTRGEFAKKMKTKGYKVVFKEFQDGSALLQALKSGSIDYARTGDTPPVTAQANGTKLTYIAAGTSKANGSGIVVGKSAGINSVSDLKGKKIAYTKNTSSEYLLRSALKKAGLSTSDVTMVNMDQSSASVAFSKGKVDAWVTWDPYTAQAQVKQNAKLLVSGKGISNNRDFILSTSSYAKNNQEVSKYLIKYLNDDMQWAQNHHTKLVTMLSKSLKLSKSVVTKMVNRRTYAIHSMSTSIVKEQQKIADLFYEEGVITKKIKVSDDVDN